MRIKIRKRIRSKSRSKRRIAGVRTPSLYLLLNPNLIPNHSSRLDGTSYDGARAQFAIDLQLLKEGSQIRLLILRQLQLQDQVEEFHSILQRKEPAIMQVRRRLLDAAER